jgi:hypothetical protein
MPLFQYFGWVGGFLLVALFAANWCFSSPIAPAPASDVPLNQGIIIRIHTEHRWPERVVFDSTSSMLVPEAKANTNTEIGGWEMPAQAERQPLDAFAQMPAMPVKPCFRPTCSGGQPAEREASPLVEDAPSQNRARKIARKTYFPQSASQAARKKLTRSRTKGGSSLRNSFAPSPIRARISIGSRIRSMKICAVLRLRLGPKGPLEPRESVWVASFKTWETAAAARSRPASWT